MNASDDSIPLPPSLLPEDLSTLSPLDLVARARAVARLGDRCHYELGSILHEVDKQPRRYGYASPLDFAEAVLGMRSRDAYDHLHLHKLLLRLPRCRERYATGDARYSNLREVVKIATAETDARWAELAVTSPYREVYNRVHEEGNAAAEKGEGAWVDSKLHGPFGKLEPVELEKRPYTPTLRFEEEVAFELYCMLLGRDTSWQEFAEARNESFKLELIRELKLDAQMLRLLRRDGSRCAVPGCSRRSGLQKHHCTHRSQGGGDEDENLILLCPAHHAAHHEGLLEVIGKGDGTFTFRWRPEVGAAWQDFPAKKNGRYQPYERAWDGPAYGRESSVRYSRARTGTTIDAGRSTGAGSSPDRPTGPSTRL